MQPRLVTAVKCVCLLFLVGATSNAQTERGFARLATHEIEITEGCAGLLVAPAPRKVTLAPGQPLPIPLPLTCSGATLHFNRFRLTLPARTDPGMISGSQAVLDAPFTVAYDLAANWAGEGTATLRAE